MDFGTVAILGFLFVVGTLSLAAAAKLRYKLSWKPRVSGAYAQKLIATARESNDPDARRSAIEELRTNPIYSELVQGETRKIRGKLHVGMSFDEVRKILGSPSAMLEGSRSAGTAEESDADFSSAALRNRLDGETLMEWNRPEGQYEFVFENGVLSIISSAPENTYAMSQAGPAAKVNQPEAQNIDSEAQPADLTMTDRDMVDLLVKLCRAYAENAGYQALEEEATKIGTLLNARGGIAEMRRVFAMIPDMRGKRTLEMHWDGIGEWRG
jgi:hypothetical protein